MDENDLLSIKEFSEYTGIKQSTLRYYDEIGLFSPVARGENDYRYYAPRQIVTVNLINVLSGLNVPLKQISDMERNRTPERILSLLTQQENRLDADLRRLQHSYSVIHTLRAMIQSGLSADENKIAVFFMEEIPITMGPLNTYEQDESFYEVFLRFCAYARGMRVNLSYPIGEYYKDMDAFQQAPSQPAHFFSVDPEGSSLKNAGRCLVGYTRCYYGQTGGLPERMTAYAKTHSLVFNGPVYSLHLHDEISVRDPEQYLLQISAPVSELIHPGSNNRSKRKN